MSQNLFCFHFEFVLFVFFLFVIDNLILNMCVMEISVEQFIQKKIQIYIECFKNA